MIEGRAKRDDVVILIEWMFMLVRTAEIIKLDPIHADGDGSDLRRIVRFIGRGGRRLEQMDQLFRMWGG